ncbi:MAG: gephyrin-like molybdotransferase Glp [Gemmatimonadota bacterium]
MPATVTAAPPLSVRDAQNRILALLRPLPAERVALAAARGRVLAEPVIAGLELPPWDNSAMDGYAVRAADVRPGVPLPVALDLPAGSVPGTRLPDGAVARIMTGAPLPAGADAVIPVEESAGPGGPGVFAAVGEPVTFTETPVCGAHLRRRGEDVRRGVPVVPAGMVCGGPQVAMAASVGQAVLSVIRRPRITIVSTGDELVDVDQAGLPGRIVNGNAYGLAAQVEEAGGVPLGLPIVPDEPAAIRSAIGAALAGADGVLTIGGVSVGERDYVRAALAAAGVALHFWRIALRPGGPTAFGMTDDGRWVLALPGNPVSALVTFELFGRPALRRLGGHARCFRRPLRARLAEAVTTPGDKAYYLRGRLQEERGDWSVTPTGAQGSAVLSSLVAADALIVVPADVDALPAGAEVTVLPLDGRAIEQADAP